jgi:hypothetical protein
MPEQYTIFILILYARSENLKPTLARLQCQSGIKQSPSMPEQYTMFMLILNARAVTLNPTHAHLQCQSGTKQSSSMPQQYTISILILNARGLTQKLPILISNAERYKTIILNARAVNNFHAHPQCQSCIMHSSVFFFFGRFRPDSLISPQNLPQIFKSTNSTGSITSSNEFTQS